MPVWKMGELTCRDKLRFLVEGKMNKKGEETKRTSGVMRDIVAMS